MRNRHRRPAFWITIVIGLSAAAAQAADVTVSVAGVNAQGGTMRVQICTRDTFLKDCPFKARAPAHHGTMDVVVKNVPPGTYAVIAHHDINNNGKVDQNLFGVPKEGVGFSRAPLLIMRAPTFDEVAVPVADPLAQVDITLKFEP